MTLRLLLRLRRENLPAGKRGAAGEFSLHLKALVGVLSLSVVLEKHEAFGLWGDAGNEWADVLFL